jgi:hypothetical protein
MARKKKSSVFVPLGDPTTISPGLNSRMEVATGFLIRHVRINGNPIFIDRFDVQPKQEIEVKWYIQGGPRASISNIGKKWVEGQMSFPARVDRDGLLPQAIRDILINSEYPIESLRIDTNHTLSYMGITAENGGSDDNTLLSLDDVVVRSCTISVSPNSEVKINVSFFGTIDANIAGNYVTPEDTEIGRKLTWNDCDASRYSSAMRTVSLLEFTIENTIEDAVFLTAMDEQRSDQIKLFGVKQCKWSGRYEEILRLGAETENFFHGGWKVGENVKFDFGGIKFYTRVPLFEMTDQPLTASMIVRKSKFISLTSPSQSNQQGKLIYFPEEEI